MDVVTILFRLVQHTFGAPVPHVAVGDLARNEAIHRFFGDLGLHCGGNVRFRLSCFTDFDVCFGRDLLRILIVHQSVRVSLPWESKTLKRKVRQMQKVIANATVHSSGRGVIRTALVQSERVT